MQTVELLYTSDYPSIDVHTDLPLRECTIFCKFLLFVLFRNSFAITSLFGALYPGCNISIIALNSGCSTIV